MPTRWWRGLTPQDVAIALVVTAFAQLDLWTNLEGANHYGPTAVAAACSAVATLALAFRRIAPTMTACVVAAAVGVPQLFTVLTFELWGDFLPMVIAAYSAARYATARRAALGYAALFAAVAVVFLRVPAVGSVANIPMAAIPLLVAIVSGRLVRDRHARHQIAEQRASSLAADRDAAIRAAVLEERGRIARELHDIVAHSVTVMVIQAGAAEDLLERNPAAARRSLEHVQETGRQAVADLGRMLGLLREPEPVPATSESDGAISLLPQPGVDDLDDLIAQFIDAGLPVEISVEGRPRPLAAGVGLTVYRVVQESLTNVIKHAAGGPARVRIAYDDNTIAVDVRDGGDDARWTPPVGSGQDRADHVGHGLVGMRERAAIYGGSITAAAQPGGGFQVTLTLPSEPGSTNVPSSEATPTKAPPTALTGAADRGTAA